MASQGLSLLFDPVSPEIWFGFEHYSYLAQRIKVHAEEFPDFQSFHLAIVGILEDRGNPSNEGAYGGADHIRRALYGLRASNMKYKVCDLGNLRPGESLEDSHLRLKEVVRILIENQVIPIIIGGTHDHTLPVVLAYEELGKAITLANVDSRSDTEPSAHMGMAHHHIGRILTRHKNSIRRYIHLGYQTYLMDENILAAIDQHHHFKMRVGEIRDNFMATEPLIRSADFLSFDVGAIKMGDAPANALAYPFGLTGEEACQMAWYAGSSSQLSAFGLFECNPSHDYRDVSASVLATMLWYFIEGYYHRSDDLSFSPSVASRISVMVTGVPDGAIVFFRSNASGKWWMEITGTDGVSEKIPCLEEDYLQCLAGDIPLRWLNQQINLS